MGYERYPRGNNPQGDYYERSDTQGYRQNAGSDRDDRYSGGRGFPSRDGGGGGYGNRDYGNQRYAQRDGQFGDRDGGRNYDRPEPSRGYGNSYGNADRGYGDRSRPGGPSEYHGSYASDGRHFEDVGRYRSADDDRYHDPDRGGGRQRSYGGQPQGYDYQDRGFIQRAGDEVRSWFGDDDAERRRNEDARRDEQYHNRGDQHGSDRHRDGDYHSWRSSQIAAFDRDFDEYRQENRSRFESEFSTWRSNRQGQRDSLGKVNEHMDVVGSDGEHVGTVDKVRGDRVLLTKNDADAGGRHHSFPSSWIRLVDDKVTLSKTAAEAKQQWRDEERNQAMFGFGDQSRTGQDGNGSSYGSASSTSTATTY